MYRSIEDVEKALADRSKAEAVMQRVSKGSKGSFTYIPWNETVRLLDDIFGPFGWSLKIVGSYNDFERGIYRTDVELTVHANNNLVSHSKTLAGTGVGVVPASQRENADAHDTAIKASRSDALSVAAKSLGNAFGLFLYDRGDPARTEPTTNNTAPARQEAPTNNESKDLGFRPSENQLKFARSLGWSDADFARMPFKQWKGILDQKQRKPGASKVAPVKPQPAPQAEPEELDLESMFG